MEPRPLPSPARWLRWHLVPFLAIGDLAGRAAAPVQGSVGRSHRRRGGGWKDRRWRPVAVDGGGDGALARRAVSGHPWRASPPSLSPPWLASPRAGSSTVRPLPSTSAGHHAREISRVENFLVGDCQTLPCLGRTTHEGGARRGTRTTQPDGLPTSTGTAFPDWERTPSRFDMPLELPAADWPTISREQVRTPRLSPGAFAFTPTSPVVRPRVSDGPVALIRSGSPRSGSSHDGVPARRSPLARAQSGESGPA